MKRGLLAACAVLVVGVAGSAWAVNDTAKGAAAGAVGGAVVAGPVGAVVGGVGGAVMGHRYAKHHPSRRYHRRHRH